MKTARDQSGVQTIDEYSIDFWLMNNLQVTHMCESVTYSAQLICYKTINCVQEVKTEVQFFIFIF